MIIKYDRIFRNEFGYSDALWRCPICDTRISHGLLHLPRTNQCACGLFYTIKHNAAQYNLAKFYLETINLIKHLRDESLIV